MKRREVITIAVSVSVVALLFVALKLSGGGKPDSSSENRIAATNGGNPSAAKPQSADNGYTPLLSDTDVERILESAVEQKFVEYYKKDFLSDDGFHRLVNTTTPYSGWVKISWESEGWGIYQIQNGEKKGPHVRFYESGQKCSEVLYENGSPVGLQTSWHENGQKASESTWKDFYETCGTSIFWHENGQKHGEWVWKDRLILSKKWWNSKGEEVETEEEADK